ncbi:MAG: hypothetical protein E4H21_01400 [Thermodesulfobacteriales bacterium]|nr:MAG: hypothetical protein E4H21_01400 [Thermodesulfobacteriales bacterium]
MGTVYERKLEIIKTTIDSDTEVRSSIMAEGKNGEMMNAYVVDSTTNGGSCMIEITNKDDHPCTEDATAKVKAELLPPRVANVCLQTFAQYTQDAIFKASQRKLIEIKLQAE